MKILITGASGFIGSYLFKSFLNSGKNVYGIVRKKSNIPFLKDNSDRLIISDLTDFNNLDRLIPKDIDMIIHAGAFNDQDTNLDIKNSYNVNVYGTRNICEIASLRNIKKFVYLSVLQVYGRELKSKINENSEIFCDNDYSLSHYLAEKICENYSKMSKIKFSILRMGYMFGCPIDDKIDRKTLIPYVICNQAVKKKKISLKGSGKARRDFVSLYCLFLNIQKIFMNKSSSLKLYNFTSGFSFSMKDIAKIVKDEATKILKTPINIEYGNLKDKGNLFKAFSKLKLYKNKNQIYLELKKEIIKIIHLINEK